MHKDSYEKAIKKFIQEYRNLPRTLGVLGLGNVGCAVAQIDAYKEGVPGNGVRGRIQGVAAGAAALQWCILGASCVACLRQLCGITSFELQLHFAARIFIRTPPSPL